MGLLYKGDYSRFGFESRVLKAVLKTPKKASVYRILEMPRQ